LQSLPQSASDGIAVLRNPGEPINRFGQLLAERNWTDQHAANELGANQVTVRCWRLGEYRPGRKFKLKLEEVFGASIVELFGAEPIRYSEPKKPAPVEEAVHRTVYRDGAQRVPDVMVNLPWVVYPKDPVTCDTIAMLIESLIANASLGQAERQYFQSERDYLRALASRQRHVKAMALEPVRRRY
jgi:DNA-binding XRE family transcriptional regulator